MRASIRYSTVTRISGAVAGLWLCGAGAAWAGGGTDLVSLQALLTNGQGTGLCDVFGISPCPQPPTVTQTALELAALGNNLFEMLLAQNKILPKGSRVYAANPAQDPPRSLLPGCLAPLPLSSATTPPTVQAALHMETCCVSVRSPAEH